MSYRPGPPVRRRRDESIHWLSIRNWDHLRNYFAPADALPARATARGVARRRRATARADARGDGADRRHRRGDDPGLTRVTMAPTPSLPGSPWHVVVRDAAGPYGPTPPSPRPPPRTRPGGCSGPRCPQPAPSGPGRQGRRGRRRACTQPSQAANADPQPTPASPRARTPNNRSVAGERRRRTRADRSLDYSADGGRRWKTISIGPDNGRVTLSTRLLSGSRNARLRVRANDGFDETAANSGRFVSAGAPPAVRILTPSRAARISADATLVAQGEAHDDAGRRLAGRRLTWRLGRRIVGRGQESARSTSGGAGACGSPRATAPAGARLPRFRCGCSR